MFTAVNLSIAAADEAQHGNYEQALAFNEAAYATRCASELMRCSLDNLWASLNPAEWVHSGINMTLTEHQIEIQKYYTDLAFVNAIGSQLGLLTPATSKELDIMLDQYEQKQLKIAQEISEAIHADIAHNFKDGIVLGLCRIGGSLAGSFILAPLAINLSLHSSARVLAIFKGAKVIDLAKIDGINNSLELARQGLQGEFDLAELQLKKQLGPDALEVGSRLKEVCDYNRPFKAKVPADAKKLSIDFTVDGIGHIFKNKTGHLLDTPENRRLLLELASDLKNYFEHPDSRGNMWCEKILDDGTQLWAEVRNGKIRNGGLNISPKKWDPVTGLARNIKK